MHKIKNSMASKLLTVLIVISILFGAIPPAIVGATGTEDAMGTIAPLIDGGAVDGNTVTFSSLELVWHEKNDAIGRYTDGWWVGIKVVAPEGMTEEQLKSSKYFSNAEKNFWDVKDSVEGADQHYIELWGVINEGYINDAIVNDKMLEYNYKFDWNADGEYEQPVKMRVDPKTVTLKKADATVYPATGADKATVELITGGVTINGNNGNIVVAEHTSKTELSWSPANPAIGRYNDGWWVGINVVAPAGADLSKVKYQNKSSSGWGEAKAFNSYKDTENSIQLWGLVNETYLNNAKENNKNVNYQWRFDWDGNGVYEQLVHIKLDPSKIVLKAENNEQVYPYLGTVTPLTGGSVSGNTSNLELLIEETTLTWSPADTSIGRNYDGWWVGMKVTAPEGYSVEQLKNATYKRRVTSSGGNSWSAYSTVNFWSVKDTADDATVHEVEIWMVINPSLVATYKTNGNNIKTECVFDWDNDGKDDQTIVMSVVPGDKIVLKKVAQTGFSFVEPNPVDKWVGEAYSNAAVGGQGSGAITYAIVSGDDVASIDASTGKLTFKKIGSVTVRATKAADDTYDEASAEYTVKAIKYPQEFFAFKNSNPNIKVEFKEGSFTNIAYGGSGTGAVSYKIISGDDFATIDENTGKVTFIAAGQITVVATKAADKDYNETTVTYTLDIEKSEQDVLEFVTAPNTITYSPDVQNVLSVSGGNGTGKITYTITDGEGVFAEIDENTGAIKTLKAGGSFTVEVNKAGDDGYEAAEPISVTIYVDYAEQTGFAFEKANPDPVTFNDAKNLFKNVASGGQGTGEIVYSFTTPTDIAEIDATTGELKILASGTVYVTATKAADDRYREATATYALTINKDVPEFNVNNVNLIYGVKEYQINVNTILGGSGNYIYTIEGANDINASVDADGKVTFADSSAKIGTITIKVKKEADSQYSELEKEITLTVSYLETSARPTFDGETMNSSGWFTDDITIFAPAGYQISYSNELSTDDWDTAVTYDVEDNVGKKSVYLKNDQGITDAIEIEGLLLDKTNPSDLSISYSASSWERLLEVVTFGYYNPAEAVVTLTAKDTGSGIAQFTFNYGTGIALASDMTISQDGTATYSFTIPSDFRDKINFSAVDVAGRETSLEDDKILVVDVTNPELTVSYNHTGVAREENGIIHTNAPTTVRFEIKESNFDLSLVKDADKPKVLLDNNPISVIWTEDTTNNVWSAECNISTVGEHKIKFEYSDLSGNAPVSYEKEIRVDDTAPIININYVGSAVKDNIYNSGRKATVTINERNFKAEDVELTVIANDITGKTVDISSKAYKEYAKDESNWTSNGNIHTLVLPDFDIDAIYNVDIAYTDLANNAADYEADIFVVDKAAADNIKIEYSKSIVDEIIEAVSFGFYQADVTVTVTAEDMTSGVDYFEITYNQVDGKNNSNKATYKTEKLEAIQDETNKNVFTATHTITAEARGTVTVDVTDEAGNESQKAEEKVLVADTIVPGLDVKYTFTDDQVREYNNIYYTKGETKVQFTVEEANFDIAVKPEVTVNSAVQAVEWTQIDGTDKWVGEITLSGNGDYIVKISFTDRSTNAMETYTKEVHIDNEVPVFEVTYDNNEVNNENNYKADRTATVKVTEHNFKAEEVEVYVEAKDILGKDVEGYTYFTGADGKTYVKEFYDYARVAGNWSNSGDVWTLNTDGTKFAIDAKYSVKIEYTDLAENEATPYTTEFVVDKTTPNNIKIEYSTSIIDKVFESITFGFYKADVTVTLTADDITSGVDYFTWSYTQEAGTSNKNKTDDTKVIGKENITYSNNGMTATASFVIDAQARGYISVDVTDMAGNTSGKVDNERINVVDNIAPTRTVSYTPERIFDAATLKDVSTFNEGDNVILYYKDSAVVTFAIDEANFYADQVDIRVNGVKKVPTDWTQNGDVWTGTITISGDGDYVVTMTYTDYSSNEMVAYESQKIAIDATAPTINVEYDNNSYLNTNNYKADRTATITIVDHNFRADDVVATITAVDVQGNPVEVMDYQAYLSNRDSWTSTGDVHVAEITYSVDAIYTFDIEYSDIIGNAAADFEMQEFVIDHNAPTDLKISYSESILEKVIETITFGFYKANVTVTLTADDITSGVDYFDWTYTKQDDTSDKNSQSNGDRITTDNITYSNEGKTATATFVIDANARGYISATVTDKAGNSDAVSDDTIINVVDNIAPSIKVNYVADDANTKVQFVDNDQVTVDTFDKAATAYYNGNVTAKLVIDEANFFEGVIAEDGVIYQVGIKLTKTDDDGNVTVTEYLPEGAVQKYPEATPEYITWTTSGDEHFFNISYDVDSDYVLDIEYTDLSTNDADISANDGVIATKAYKSKVVTVDKTAPVVSVEYANKDIIHTIDGRDYFDAAQTATITVQEHNFRADDFIATVTAKDILDADVNVEDFKATLSDDSKWIKNGNTYTNVIEYTVDANYTFDYEYKDLAQNVAADYETDLFTVDTTAPENLTVEYSDSVRDKILQAITFGYYNEKMTVTISAEDDTAGIYSFVYSYIKSAGVSNVNAELLNDRIADANNNIVHKGKKSTASFSIPKKILDKESQFNGTVEFTAYDRSENNTKKVDNQRVVVDNIKPTATITYNTPVQKANDISYYAGNIDAKIVINEANFYKEDVVVEITKDGARYPMAVKWVDNSVDVHTGTFTLTQDGDYIVKVVYVDRSNNEMTTYTSNRLTIDTKAPTVNVTNIKMNSANKDETYTFTLTANDINIDASSIKPVLTATIRNDDGSYGTKTVSLGDMRTVKAGETYSFTVGNLADDAVYSLVCTLKDMSGNAYSKIALSDGREYDNVRFSINRNGSTFAVDKNTQDLVDKYFVYSVDQDVVVEEVNVDPVETYTVKLNGKALVEGKDYTSTLSNNAGEWSKRTYIISKENFKSEGEYSIVIESTDKTETTSYSDVKNLNVSFVVDQTAPILTISGLENGGRYQVKEQIVTVIPTDDGGRLYSIKVVVMDSDGEPLKDANGKDISVRFEMSGDELLAYLAENDGKISFTVPEGLENQVQIICNDCAVNADGKTNEYNQTFTKATVSQSKWVIFYATKPLFYGTIAGTVLLVGGIIFLIFLKKRKKEEDK